MIQFTIIYLIIGLIWTKWLEDYTKNYLQLPSMDSIEISINVIFWPLQLVVFLYHFFNNL